MSCQGDEEGDTTPRPKGPSAADLQMLLTEKDADIQEKVLELKAFEVKNAELTGQARMLIVKPHL